jgi:hypothetical protein
MLSGQEAATSRETQPATRSHVPLAVKMGESDKADRHVAIRSRRVSVSVSGLCLGISIGSRYRIDWALRFVSTKLLRWVIVPRGGRKSASASPNLPKPKTEDPESGLCSCLGRSRQSGATIQVDRDPWPPYFARRAELAVAGVAV